MTQTVQRRPEPTERTIPEDRTALVKLLGELAQHGRFGASTAIAGSMDARQWPELENTIDDLMQQRSAWDLAKIRACNGAIAAAARRQLRMRSDDTARETAYAQFADEVERWGDAWTMVAPEAVLAHHLHHALLWVTAWHLLTAGLSMDRVLRVLTVQSSSSTGPILKRPTLVVPTITVSWRQVPGGLQSAAAAGWRVSSKIGVAVVRGVHQGVASQAAARKTQAVKAMETVQRRAGEEALKSAQAAQQQRPAPDDTHGARTEPATTQATSLQLDGTRLNRSLFPTWLSLVFLSWVSLIWGGLLSAPIGVGFGILATAFAGIFAVPLWGTIFGFLGMPAARSSTLTSMGFAKLPDDSQLAQTSATYARSLGITAPSIGTVNVYNAFAMGTDRNDATVALGQPLLERLTERETEAVLGHELGHIVSGDMRRMMLMRTFQNATVWFLMFQGVKQLARWIICWAAELYILNHSRKREYWADAIGAALAGKDAMIGALKKLEQAPALSGAEQTHARFMVRGRPAGLLSTHPSFDQRIQALQNETYIRKLPVRPTSS
jgi:heat shock protein HtpX